VAYLKLREQCVGIYGPARYTAGMPTFFEGMKRIFKGKPVFADDDYYHTAPDQNQPVPQPGERPAAPQSRIQKNNPSTFPVVYLKHSNTHINGNRMEVYCRIVNTWPAEVLIDKIYMFGVKREIDATLRAGQEREFLVYSGSKLTKQYFESRLDYKTHEEGDYFEAIHDITFLYHSEDKTYTVNDIRLRRPVKDIYG